MMEYQEFGRSGTAPSKNSKGTTQSQRVRPKTRGVVTGAGASELADLNMSLKLDKGSGSGSGSGNSGAYYDVSDDPIEDFQSAVESWERARRTRQTTERESNTAGSARKSRSAYTGGDPVSAAYSSQFKTAKTPSGRGSPRASQNNKARAVAELHAAYGIGDNGQQGSGRKSTTNASSTRRSTGIGGSSSEGTSSRPSSRSGVRSSTAGTAKRKEPLAAAAVPPADRPSASSGDPTMTSQLRPGGSRPLSKSTRTSTSYGAGGASSGVSTNTWRPATDKPPEPSSVHSSHLVRAEAGAGGSSGTLTGNGTAAKRHVIPSPPAAQVSQSSVSTTPYASSNDQSAKSSFRRRHDHYRAVSAGGGSSSARRDEGSGEGMLYSTSSTAPSTASATINGLGRTSPDGVVAKREADILDMVSPSIEIDDDGSELAENAGYAATSSFAEGELQRPQSRKLYLGSAGTPTNAQNRTGEGKDGSSSGMDGNTARAPRSAGAKPRHCMSPEQKGQQSVDAGREPMTMERNSSFGGFVQKSSSRWKDTSVNYDDRPPSRQRSAFPTHLADVDAGMGRGGFRDKKQAFSDIICSDQEIAGAGASASSVASGSSPRSTRGNFTSCDLVVERPNDRPPSRQKLRAQNLFDNDSDFDAGGITLGDRPTAPNELDVMKPEPMKNGSGVDMGFVSPVLTPNDSCISVGVIDIGDGVDSAPTSPPPRVPRSAFDASSLGPMNDPTADGFTQLDRSTTAPFKIRYNPSPRATGGNRAHSASTGSSDNSTSNCKKATYKKEPSRGSPVAGFMWHKVGIAHDMGHSWDDRDSSSPKMGVSQSTPSLYSPAKGRVPSRESDCDRGLSKSASSSDHLLYQSEDGEAFLQQRRVQVRESHPEDYLDEELTVMTMYSDDDNNDSPPDTNDLMLGSSLGEDFLNLFARGGR